MEFDLRTCDAAYDFILNFMDMTSYEFITEYTINCDNDFEKFWDRNIYRIASVDISEIKIMAFHILGSLDDCKGIKENGLINLQNVLSSDTILKKMLERAEIVFDILAKTVSCNGKTYNIDYTYYQDKLFLNGIDEKLKKISYRVFYDYCVNGFLLSDDVFNYGTNIHKRPEFLMDLGELFSQAQKVESIWKCNSKSYRIDFYATIDQIQRFNFDLDEYRDPPFEGWAQLDDYMKIKKWMLSHAIDRVYNVTCEQYIYVKNNITILPNQILSISELTPKT